MVHDPEARLPEFMHPFCSFSARALNVLHGQVGPVWELGSYSAVKLETPNDVVDKIAYLLANPVAAGLVPTPEEFPGLITPVASLGRGMRPTQRPGYFFRKEDDEGEAKRKAGDHRPGGWSDARLPGAVVWELAVPPGFEDDEDLQRRVRSALDDKLEKIHAERRRTGARPFVGAKALRGQSILETPATYEERFRLNPRLACKDWTRRAQACRGWVAFQLSHRVAFAEFRDGDRSVVFPAGTYRMRVHFGVTCDDGGSCSGGAGA